jgi:hypothetical protein
MPQRTMLETAGRYDLARAMEKWGGIAEVASLVGMAVSHKARGGRRSREEEEPWPTHMAEVKIRTGLQGKALYRAAAACYDPPDPPSRAAGSLRKRKVKATAKARAKRKTPADANK